jgi:tocopherol O-methyltransferase
MQDREEITRVITDFWNQTSDGWRTIWGPHIHHGFYADNSSLTPLEAQELLINKLATSLEIAPQDKILDAGCGMGGSSIYLAKNYAAHVTGITISQKQASIAIQDAAYHRVSNVSFLIEDALRLNSFKDNSLDIIWSLESCEQFYDKSLFIQQAYRVLKPAGKLMLATWCSDKEEYEGHHAKQYKKLCLAFDLPCMPTIEYYNTLLCSHAFRISQSHDWSKEVMKSWDVGLSLANAYSVIQLIRMGGWRGYRFIKQARLMREAFRLGRVRYGVFIAAKPA